MGEMIKEVGPKDKNTGGSEATGGEYVPSWKECRGETLPGDKQRRRGAIFMSPAFLFSVLLRKNSTDREHARFPLWGFTYLRICPSPVKSIRHLPSANSDLSYTHQSQGRDRQNQIAEALMNRLYGAGAPRNVQETHIDFHSAFDLYFSTSENI